MDEAVNSGSKIYKCTKFCQAYNFATMEGADRKLLGNILPGVRQGLFKAE